MGMDSDNGAQETVHSVKDGRVLVKKVIPLADCTDMVQKTVEAEHGFLLEELMHPCFFVAKTCTYKEIRFETTLVISFSNDVTIDSNDCI
jgi:hypothetical protein